MRKAFFNRQKMASLLVCSGAWISLGLQAQEAEVKALAGSPPSASAANASSAASLPEVVVNAQMPSDASALDRSALVLDQGATWSLRRAGSLGESLREIPGVGSTYYGPNASRPILRGQEGERVTVLQNGGSNSDVSGLSPDHASAIDPWSVERVEWLRGPAALLYAPSIDAVLDLQDSRIAHESPFASSLPAEPGVRGQIDWSLGGAAKENNQALLLEAGRDQWVWHVDAFERRAQDTAVNTPLSCTQNGVTTTERRICNSDAQASGQGLGGTWLGERARLGLSWSGQHHNYGTVAEDDVRIDMRNARWSTQGAWQPRTGPWREWRAQFNQNDYQHSELEAGVVGTVFKVQGRQWRLDGEQMARSLPGPAGGADWTWRGQSGLSWQDRGFSALGDEAFAPNSQSRIWSLFSHQELQWQRYRLQVAARTEGHRIQSLGSDNVSRFVADERQFQPWSLALQLQRSLDAQWQISADAAWLQRAPTEAELFADGPHLATAQYVVGNAQLQPERMRHGGLGLQWQGARSRASLNAYMKHYDNYIALQATGFDNDAENNAGARANGGLGANATDCGDGHSTQSGCSARLLHEYIYQGVPARIAGLEASGSLGLNAGVSALESQVQHPKESQDQAAMPKGETTRSSAQTDSSEPPARLAGRWDVEWRASALRTRNLQTNEPLPRMPPLQWGAALVWTNGAVTSGQWLGRLGFDRSEAQNAVPTGDLPTPAYTLWNASAQYRRNWAWGGVSTQNLFYLKLHNLSDQVAYSATSVLTQTVPGKAPLPGRSLKLGWQLLF